MAEADGIPGKGWYTLAGGIALISILLAIGLIAWAIMTHDAGKQFLAPGGIVVELQPNGHTVWNDYVTEFEGHRYNESETLPATTLITVTDLKSGQAITVRSGVKMTATHGDTSRTAAVVFDVARQSRYRVNVQGDFPPRVFSVAKESIVATAIFGTLAILFFGLGAAAFIGGWVYMKSDEAKQAAAQAEAVVPATGDADETSLKRLTAIVYALQIATFFVGITLFAAPIINYLKRDEVAGTWLESHFHWQIRTFWYSLLWLFVGVALLIFFVGFFVLMMALMWLLYRAIKGWLQLEENKPMSGISREA